MKCIDCNNETFSHYKGTLFVCAECGQFNETPGTSVKEKKCGKALIVNIYVKGWMRKEEKTVIG